MTIIKYYRPIAHSRCRLIPSVFLVCIAVVLATVGCGSNQRVFLRDPSFELADSSKTIVCIPTDSITVEYIDRTKATPDTLFSDSFFIEAANNLLEFEASKKFMLRPAMENTSDIFDSLCFGLINKKYSRIADSLYPIDSVSALVCRAAKIAGADLVMIPYNISLKHLMYQSRSWRGGGPSYEKPVTFQAYASAHIQIWNSKGELLYETAGTGDAGRPIMYSLFGKEKPGEDVVKYAKNLFAPPLLRALYGAIMDAVRFRK